MSNTILIADDAMVNLVLMRDFLIDCGYNVVEAKNGKEAFELAHKYKPDLILMDWQMPIMTGVESLVLLKQNAITKEIPVIIVTGIATTVEHLQEAFDKGAIDFIKKPFEKIELLARVNSMLTFIKYYKLVIEQKNKELSMSMLQLNRLTELHNQITKKMKNLSDLSPDSKQIINDITGNISVQLLNEAWNRFENYFTEIRPDFYNNLAKAHNNLTPSELRLCTLLSLNMDSKEIATFTHQEYNSVRVSRSRLRKKIGLSDTDNLVNYLMTF
ncbi:MAG: hypothetical protein A2033_16975 [Bacteroidetes bacterium GWA2_31_9]|nr:MAG: hypothetical protein A2033_16975 [Bacteroidetes bacterium GWA2_31_9]